MPERKHNLSARLANQPAAIWLLALLFCLMAGLADAEDAGPSEYQVKAAFLYNFAKFIKWPENSFPATNSPLTIGILGNNPFGKDLDLAVKDKTINGHPLVVKSIGPAELNACNVVFICRTPKRNIGETLEPLKGAAVLTVSEVEHFTETGGMIRFEMEEHKVRFLINDVTAKSAGLTISSKLLSLSMKKGGS